jgi:hypothetical protein
MEITLIHKQGAITPSTLDTLNETINTICDQEGSDSVVVKVKLRGENETLAPVGQELRKVFSANLVWDKKARTIFYFNVRRI